MYQRYRAKEPPPVRQEAKPTNKPKPVPHSRPLPSLLSGFDSGDALALLILLLLLMEGNKESSSLILTLTIFLLLR